VLLRKSTVQCVVQNNNHHSVFDICAVNNNKMLVLAFTGFRGKNREMVVKELAAVSATDRSDNMRVQTFLFYPPYPDSCIPPDVRRTNYWIESHLGVTKWEEGHVAYWRLRSLLADLCSKETPVYAKGGECVKFLNGFLPDKVVVRDLDLEGCPKADDIRVTGDVVCGLSDHGMSNCALTKATKYITWLKNKEKQQRRQESEQDQQQYELFPTPTTLSGKLASLGLA
jgi:hypothetical protein